MIFGQVMCIAEHMNPEIFGSPRSSVKNLHNLWDDLELEYKNNSLTDIFIQLLRSLNLKSKNRVLIM